MLTLASCVHNGEQDPEYRDRRNMIVSLARSYKHGMVWFRLSKPHHPSREWLTTHNPACHPAPPSRR